MNNNSPLHFIAGLLVAILYAVGGPKVQGNMEFLMYAAIALFVVWVGVVVVKAFFTSTMEAPSTERWTRVSLVVAIACGVLFWGFGIETHFVAYTFWIAVASLAYFSHKAEKA